MKYAQLVIGPAGCGKSTFCSLMQEHCAAAKRECRVINFDPAAEVFQYECFADVRDVIAVTDVMEEMDYGPNGGLVFAMEYILQELEWLEDQVANIGEDELFLIDCPGQIELYTHIPVMRQVVKALDGWGVRVAAVYCLDVGFITDSSKFIAGTLSALSAMVQLELPHVNVLTKCDLVDDRAQIDSILDSEAWELISDLQGLTQSRYKELCIAMGSLLEEFNLVSYITLDPNDEDSIATVVAAVDGAIQFGEDAEPKANFDMNEEEEIDA
eukprot:Selendium_serpulae@DN5242_c0_g1_i5.p2